MIEPGMVAFFTILAVLTAAYALFTPQRTIIIEDTLRPEGYTPTTFDKFIRPAVRNFMPLAPTQVLAYAQGNTNVSTLLVRSGNPWAITPEEFVIFRIISAIGLAAGISFYSFLGFFPVSPMLALPLGLIMGWMLPQVLLSSAWNRRKKELARTLPEALDLLRICLNAGYNFSNALSEVIYLLPPGATRQELTRVVADLRSGRTVAQAMKDFAKRAPLEQVEAFVRAVNVSQSMGTDMAVTLANQADEARAEYERLVEVKAQKLQTTLFLPIIALFLPSLVILIFGPAISELGSVL